MTHLIKLRTEPDPSGQSRAISRLMIAVAAALLVSTPALHAGKLYKWIDESGQVRYGDRVPPEYAKRRNETLNSQGIVVETKAAQKTKEQLAEEQRVAALQAAEERRKSEQARKDRILLDTFTNEDEMILTRDGKLEAIEAVIRVTKGRIEKLRQRLSDLTRRAANLERAGRPIAPELSEQIADSRSQIRHNLQYIENRKQEQHAIREKFEQDIKRFRELKLAEAEARAAQH